MATVECYTCLRELAADQQFVFDCGNVHNNRICETCAATWLRESNRCPECRSRITAFIQINNRPPVVEEAPPVAAQPPTLAEVVANLLPALNNTLEQQQRSDDENRRLRNIVGQQQFELEQLRNRITMLEDQLARRNLANDNLQGLLDNIRAMIPRTRREREEEMPAPRPRAKAKRAGRVVDVDDE